MLTAGNANDAIFSILGYPGNFAQNSKKTTAQLALDLQNHINAGNFVTANVGMLYAGDTASGWPSLTGLIANHNYTVLDFINLPKDE